jgi:hypothetical protein
VPRASENKAKMQRTAITTLRRLRQLQSTVHGHVSLRAVGTAAQQEPAMPGIDPLPLVGQV